MSNNSPWRGGGNSPGGENRGLPFRPGGGASGQGGSPGRGVGSTGREGGSPVRGGGSPARGGGSPARGGAPALSGNYNYGISRVPPQGGGRSGVQDIYSQDSGPVEDLKTKNKENETAMNLKLHTANKKDLDKSEMPFRPGFVELGRPVLLWANYFRLTVKNFVVIHSYAIEIRQIGGDRNPTGKKAKRIIEQFLEGDLKSHKQHIATDFRSNLLSTQEFECPEEGFLVTYKAEDEDIAAPNARQYRLFLKETGWGTIGSLIDYLNETQAVRSVENKEHMLQSLNIILGHHPKASPGVTNIGANKHCKLHPDDLDTMDIGAGLHAVRGIIVSVRGATGSLLVNVQVKSMAFYDEGSLANLMQNFERWEGGWKTKFKLDRFLKRLPVNVTHNSKKNNKGAPIRKMRRLLGLASEQDGRPLNKPLVTEFGADSKNVKFLENGNDGSPSKSTHIHEESKRVGNVDPKPLPNGNYISVFDYFKRRYQKTLGYPDLSVVNIGTRKDPVYLPAEVSRVLPGQPVMGALSGKQVENMIKFAVRQPASNAQSVIKLGAQLLGLNAQNQTLQNFGLNIEPKLLAVPGRVLVPPMIYYAKKQTIPPKHGSWNMLNVNLLEKKELKQIRWSFLKIMLLKQQNREVNSPPKQPNQENDPIKTNQDADDFTLDARKKMGIESAIFIGGVSVIITKDTMNSRVEAAIKRYHRHPDGPPDLILVIIPEEFKTPVYKQVKYVCDIKEGILNVCIRDSRLKNAKLQTFANIGLKINLKFGGRNHGLDPSKLDIIGEGKTMLVGLDVTHPSHDSSSGAQSCAGIVASVDSRLAQWPGELSVQTRRQEIVDDLEVLIARCLVRWKNRNNSLPEFIIMYRDGVSEGQYEDVLRKELPAIKSGCEKVYRGKKIPKMTIVIVGKRHHTRFYPTKKSDVDMFLNPSNGTVVDRGVTEAHNWDFFLQAHTAIKGTAKPAHYYVIYDDIFRHRKVVHPFKSAADVIINLTHNLSYLQGRTTTAVGVCPPALYADMLCDRARCYLKDYFDPEQASNTEGSDAEQGPSIAELNRLVTFHDNVKEKMVYI